MAPDEIIHSITQHKHKLDAYHETGDDYLPPELMGLRAYIIQVHAAYEKAISALISINYMKSNLDVSKFLELMASLTFEEKLQAVQSVESDFPSGSAKKLNSLRNLFIHRQGKELRTRYGTNTAILKKLKSLSVYYDDLNQFWLSYQGGMSPDDARAHIEMNNKRFFS